jgi:hypothetical protein
MISVSHPTFRIDARGRDAECERAMNVAFYALLREATEAGWDVAEASRAIAKIASRAAQQPPAEEFDWYTGTPKSH